MKRAKYNANVVAGFVVDYCNSKDYMVDNLKLQKILYFIQAKFLRDLDVPCFTQNIEAWDFGPVVPEVYRLYRIYGSGEIPEPINSGTRSIHITKEDKKRISDMVSACSAYSAADLVKITHRQDPWKIAYTESGNNIITNESIRNYFHGNRK